MMIDDSTTDDVLPGAVGLDDEEAEAAGDMDDVLPPPDMGDGDDGDETDEEIISGEFTSDEDEENKFDPENPDDYLYNSPGIKYSDSAEEDESDWASEEEGF